MDITLHTDITIWPSSPEKAHKLKTRTDIKNHFDEKLLQQQGMPEQVFKIQIDRLVGLVSF